MNSPRGEHRWFYNFRVEIRRYEDYTVLEISPFVTRMLARHTHPTKARNRCDRFASRAHNLGTEENAASDRSDTASEIGELLKEFGGRQFFELFSINLLLGSVARAHAGRLRDA